MSDRWVLFRTEEGDTKDDLQLPSFPEGFGQEIKKQFDDGKTLVSEGLLGTHWCGGLFAGFAFPAPALCRVGLMPVTGCCTSWPFV